MPITPNFTTSQMLATPNIVTFNDTSSGNDGNITERRIYIRLANGNWLTSLGESSISSYDIWPILSNSISLDLLKRSMAADVTIKWMNGGTELYNFKKSQYWNVFDYLFGLELIQAQTATPKIIQDSSYYNKFFQFISNIWASESCIIYGDDVYSSQQQLDNNNYIINNRQFFF